MFGTLNYIRLRICPSSWPGLRIVAVKLVSRISPIVSSALFCTHRIGIEALFFIFFFLRIDGLNLNISVDSYTSIHSPSVNYIIQKGECSLEKRKTKKINKKIKDRSRENLLAVEQMALILRNQCRPISTFQNAPTETKEIAKGVKTLPLNSDPLNFTESIKGFR